MKVQIVAGEVPSPEAGGIGTVVHHLDAQFRGEDVETEIVCTDTYDTKDVTSLSAPGPHPFQDLTFGRSYRRYVNSQVDDVDVFHFHLPNARGPLLMAPDWVRERAVVSLHTTPWGYHEYLYESLPYSRLDASGKLHKLGYSSVPVAMERRALRGVPVVTAVSNGVADEAKRAYGVECEVVHNGVDTDTLPTSEDADGETLLFVGRLVPQKGLERGLRALDSCEADFEVQVVGTGPLDDRLKNIARRRPYDVEFLGFVERERLDRAYAEADVLFMPSYYEGLPMVGIEGAGSALPIVASKGARVDDIVSDVNDKLLFAGRDSEAVARAVDMAFDDSDLKRIGARNRERVKARFTVSQMASAYMEHFGLVR